ncbi:ATP-binding protein [Bergeriella denitrificans]|uniref:histidine kinase n=1 Tax=Bergeriella denitrificans TaxID=494 RepID=A0A378UJM6_BERDE|nr:ATP-binding protein [Bergeriella denitrificans]STZ77320.1 protein BasS [Bergeriella denitrificans]
MNLIRYFRHSLQIKISLALTAAALTAALAAGAVAFWDTYTETHKLQDDLLRQTARHLEASTRLSGDEADSDADAQIDVQTSDTPADQRRFDPDRYPESGFYTLEDDGDTLRLYIQRDGGHYTAVMQENEYRDDLAEAAAWNSALPPLLLIPLTALLTFWITRRTLRPVRRLSEELAQRDEGDLTPLDETGVPSEIRGFVSAVNRQFARSADMMAQQQRFIADAAHELRSPLTALSLQAERLDDAALPPDIRAQIADMRQSIRRNRHLTEQLLSLARAQSAAEPRRSALSARDLMRRLIEDLLPISSAKAQDLGVEGDGDVTLYADDTAVYTLIKTLADNAVRYTPAGGRIDLSCRRENGWVVFAVEDDGPGIPAAERARVLDPFYRILGSGEQGTGLGLSIADNIAKRYGGRIRLSDSPNFEHGLLAEAWLAAHLLREKAA